MTPYLLCVFAISLLSTVCNIYSQHCTTVMCTQQWPAVEIYTPSWLTMMNFVQMSKQFEYTLHRLWQTIHCSVFEEVYPWSSLTTCAIDCATYLDCSPSTLNRIVFLSPHHSHVYMTADGAYTYSQPTQECTNSLSTTL